MSMGFLIIQNHSPCDQNGGGMMIVMIVRLRVMMSLCVCVYVRVCARACFGVVDKHQSENVDLAHVHVPIMQCR